MADHHDSHGEYKHGEMDISQHQHSYDLFANLTKWGSFHLAYLLTFLVILTCTQLGLLAAVVSAVVVAGVGFFLLRKKPDASH